MRNLKLTHLRCFVAVAESGSVTQAAKKLHRSISAVSMTVCNLENQLGQSLFEHEGKSKLTPFGQYVFETGKEQVIRFDNAMAGIDAYAGNGIGRVDIAAVPSYATLYMPRMLSNFIKKHPKITFRISDNSSLQIKKMVQRGEIDFGIASYSEDLQEEDFKPLVTDPMGLVCSKNHRLAKLSEPVDWSEIEQDVFITNGTCDLIKAPQFKPILKNSEIMVQNTTSLLALVAAGVGVTTLPRQAVPIDREDVVFKEIDNLNLIRTLGILTHKGRTLSPAANACAEFIFQNTIIGDLSSMRR